MMQRLWEKYWKETLTRPGEPYSSMGHGTVLKLLGTFQTCSHRTTLISFALGACSGPAASNAWQEMSQYDGGRSLAIPMFLSKHGSGSQAADSLYRLI